jgi:hypothetical protein
MTWIRRQKQPVHVCEPPMREVAYSLPGGPALRPDPSVQRLRLQVVQVDGQIGDLWRCDVDGRVWRVAHACDACDCYGVGNHGGQCQVGRKWRQATSWQRLRYRRDGKARG